MHRSRTVPILAITLALLVGSCGGNGKTTDITPKAEITTPTGPLSGIIDIDFVLIQNKSFDINILPEFSLDGAVTFQRATAAPGTSILGLASAPGAGVSHTFQWESRSDGVALTAPENGVVFRITPYLNFPGVAAETLPFAVDNTASTFIASISPEWGPIGTSIAIDGSGFTTVPGDHVVTFGDVGGGGIPATPSVANPTQLIVDVPDPSPRPLRDLSGPLTVTVQGVKTNPVQFVATTAGGPQISVIHPTSIEGNSLPWYAGSSAWVRVQLLYRASEIGSAGVIDGLRWATSTGLSGPNPNTVTVQSVKVRMAHTTQDAPNHVQQLNYDVDIPREVASISNYTIPADLRGFVDIPLNGVFPYNGRDNLLIEIEGTGGSGPYFWNVGRRPGEVRAWRFSNGNGWRDIVLHAIEMSFLETDTDDSHSAVMAAVFNIKRNGPCGPPDCPPIDTVLPTRESKLQFILLSREISGSGILKGIAWKPRGTSNAATYTNLAVSVKETFLNTLTDTFESGLTQVRAPAPYDVPAGETGFIPIPLDAPYTFNYSGTDHLLIEITSLGGTVLNEADGLDIGPERRFVWASQVAATTGTLETDIASIRLEFE